MVEYRDGNLLTAKVDIIAHQVNCQGKMNSGFAKDLKTRSRNLLQEYRQMCKEHRFSESLMGMTQIVESEGYSAKGREGAKKLVANLFAQFTESQEGIRTTDYTSLKQAFLHLKAMCETLDFATKDGTWTIGIPYGIGCGYGGGDWKIVEKIIHDIFDESQVITAVIFKKESKEDDN